MRGAWSRLPDDSLARIRLIFVLFSVCSAALLLVMLVGAHHEVAATLPLGVLAVGVLAVKWFADYRRPRHHVGWDLAEAGALLGLGVATENPLSILLLLYARDAVCVLEASTRTAIIATTGYALAFAGTIALTGGGPGTSVVEDILLGSGMPLVPTIMGLLSDLLRRLAASTERERQLAAELGASFSHLFDSNPQPMWVHDEATLRFLAVNDAAVHHYGWTREEFTAMSVADVEEGEGETLAPAHDAAGAIDVVRGRRHHTRDGRVLAVETTSHRMTFAGRAAVFVTARDVTAEHALQAQLRQQAFHDLLTGLPNRALLDDRAAQALRRSQRSGRGPVMLVLDLDGFKGINDTVGHSVGDEVIRLVGERIGGCLRPADTAARLGGDEFAVLLEDVDSVGDVEAVARRLILAIEEPYLVSGRQLALSACIGISECHDPANGVSGMLNDADMAMYVAKARGRGSHQVFTPELRTAHRERQRMQEHLTGALRNGELSVVYQPQLDLGSRRVTGVEALVRWHSPVHGNVPPDVFIPLAEQLGLVTDIDLFVLRTACADVVRLRTRGGHALRVAVNISGRDLESPTLVEDVRRALLEQKLDPWHLELELTEGVAVLQPEDAVSQLEALRALGIRIGIDDFGTGYSMFGRLRELPIDRLKIDRSFVRDLGSDDDDAAIVASMIAMGHALGLTLVAEGVETEAALDMLAAMECDSAQGYLICKPIPADEVGAWMATSPWAVGRPKVSLV